MSDATRTQDKQCRGCWAWFEGYRLEWYYVVVEGETHGPYCENCYKRGVTIKLKQTVSTTRQPPTVAGFEAADEA